MHFVIFTIYAVRNVRGQMPENCSRWGNVREECRGNVGEMSYILYVHMHIGM